MRPIAAVALFLSLPIALIFWFHDVHDLQALGRIKYHEWGYRYFEISGGVGSLWVLRLLFTGIAAGTFLFLSTHRRSTILQPGLLHFIVSPFRQMDKTDLKLTWAIAITIVSVRIYHLITYPLHTDEVASYDYFVSKGWLATLVFYPMPNNHIFFNMIAGMFHVFFTDILWTMRVPTLLIGLAGTLVVHSMLLRITAPLVAVLTTAFFSFSGMSLYLMVIGRGYAILFTCAAISSLALILLRRGGSHQRLFWILYFFCTVAGSITVPTYLYALLANLLFGLYIFRSSAYRKQLKPLAITTGAAIALTIILYMPVLLVSGTSALFENRYLASLPLTVASERMLDHLILSEQLLFGSIVLQPWLFLSVVTGGTLMLFSKEHRGPTLLCLLHILLPYMIATLQGVLPPERVLFPKHFFFVLLLALLVHAAAKRLLAGKRLVYLVLSIPLAYGITQIHSLEGATAKRKEDLENIESSHQILMSTPSEEVLIQYGMYELYLLHHAYRDGGHQRLHCDPATLQGIPEWILIGHASDDPDTIDRNGYELFMHNNDVSMYRRKAADDVPEAE